MLRSLLQQNRMILMVSLPDNDVEMAMAALKGGADAIKVHLRSADDTPYEEFEEIIKVAGNTPVGIVPPPEVTSDELRYLEDMGFDFLNFYAHNATVEEYQDLKITKIIALDSSYEIDQVTDLSGLGFDAVEAAIIPKSDFQKRLNYQDIIKCRTYYHVVRLPLFAPALKLIQPAEVQTLELIGVQGVVIGAFSTGRTLQGIESTTRSFKDKIDNKGY
jgi:hypothetical protein